MKPSVPVVVLRKRLLKWASENLRSADTNLVGADETLRKLGVLAQEKHRLSYEHDRASLRLVTKAVAAALRFQKAHRFLVVAGQYPSPAIFSLNEEDLSDLLDKMAAESEEVSLRLGSVSADGAIVLYLPSVGSPNEFRVVAEGAWKGAIDTIKSIVENGEEYKQLR